VKRSKNFKTFSQSHLAVRMDEKSMSSPIKQTPLTSISENNNQMKAILTADGKIKIILPSTLSDDHSKENFLSKDLKVPKTALLSTSTASSNNSSNSKMRNFIDESEGDEEEEDDKYAQFKMTPKQTFCSSICQVSDASLCATVY
jgi:hypothetical protein